MMGKIEKDQAIDQFDVDYLTKDFLNQYATLAIVFR